LLAAAPPEVDAAAVRLIETKPSTAQGGCADPPRPPRTKSLP